MANGVKNHFGQENVSASARVRNETKGSWPMSKGDVNIAKGSRL